jgi:hypothetical protein
MSSNALPLPLPSSVPLPLADPAGLCSPGSTPTGALDPAVVHAVTASAASAIDRMPRPIARRGPRAP